MARVSTILAGVFRFDSIVRQEGARGRRVAIPKPVVRGLLRTGWDRRSPLRVVVKGVAWTAVARGMGAATVLALPAACVGDINGVVTLELWQAEPAVKEYLDEVEQ